MEARSIRRCPECGSTMLIRDYENAEIACMGCGFVVATRMADRGPEWRAFDREQMERRERAGSLRCSVCFIKSPLRIGVLKGLS